MEVTYDLERSMPIKILITYISEKRDMSHHTGTQGKYIG